MVLQNKHKQAAARKYATPTAPRERKALHSNADRYEEPTTEEEPDEEGQSSVPHTITSTHKSIELALAEAEAAEINNFVTKTNQATSSKLFITTQDEGDRDDSFDNLLKSTTVERPKKKIYVQPETNKIMIDATAQKKVNDSTSSSYSWS